jgi:hypothetical protein
MTALPSRAIALILSSGERASVTHTNGDHTTLEVPKAFPHGSTISAQIVGSEFNLEVKVFRCQRQGEQYRVDGRVKNRSRGLITLLVAAPSSPDDPR